MSATATLLGMCCGVGFVTVFLGVVLVFFFVALVGTVSDAVEWLSSRVVRPTPTIALRVG